MLILLTVRPEALRQFEKTVLETTSSFFWSSPDEFWSPCRPVKLEMPALFTMDAICLHATATEDSTTASSLSILPACSSCNDNKVVDTETCCSALQHERTKTELPSAHSHLEQPESKGLHGILVMVRCRCLLLRRGLLCGNGLQT